MKTVKAILLSLLFAFVSVSMSAAPHINNDADKELRTKLVSLVGHSHFQSIGLKKDTDAVVKFIVTKTNEILVLSVSSDYRSLDNYIKGKLNYKSINVKGVQKMVPYKIKMTFQKRNEA